MRRLQAQSADTAKTAEENTPNTAAPPSYPAARQGDHVDDYHGTKVADPYRWLEDPDSPETRAWVEAENKVTFAYLAKIPQREAIRKRLTKLWDYEKYGVPTTAAGGISTPATTACRTRACSTRPTRSTANRANCSTPTRSQPTAPWRSRGIEISDDGKLLAYGLATAGSDWQEWRVRDVDTGKDLRRSLEVGQVLAASPGRPTARASSTAATTSRRPATPN